jgi:hypothetical protein
METTEIYNRLDDIYNLILAAHNSILQEKWKTSPLLRDLVKDLYLIEGKLLDIID